MIRDAFVSWSDRRGGSTSYGHALRDLSSNGLAFRCHDRTLRVGDLLCLTLVVPALSRPLVLSGRVKRVFRHGRRVFAGVHFDPLALAAKHSLERLLRGDRLIQPRH